METRLILEARGETTMIHGWVEQIPTAGIGKHGEAVAYSTSTSHGCGWFAYYILGLAFLVAPLLRGQEVQPAAMAGTRLRVKFESSVGTAISRVGDGVQVQLLKAVEAEGREVLPAGTILTGRVLAARKGNKHTKTFPMIRLGFTRATLPDDRSFPMQASLADLGVSEYVDSEGAASTKPPTKGGDVAVPVTTGAAGAGIGAIAGGGKGAAIGAGVGGAIGVLSDLAAHSLQWDDFELKKGRKAWLRLDQDLQPIPASPHAPRKADPATKAPPSPVAQELPNPPASEYPETMPRSPLPSPKAPPPSLPNSEVSTREVPLRSLALGWWRVIPTYMDTGPFAAAEEGAYWTPSGSQYVVVGSNGLSNYEGSPSSLVRLETENGRVYPPLGAHRQDAMSPLPQELLRSPWVFKVAEGEKPARLLVENPDPRDRVCGPGCFPHGAPLGIYWVPPSSNCPGGCDPGWRESGSDRAALSLDGLPSLNNIAEVEQRSTPARLGQLEIKVTDVGLASGDWDNVRVLTPEHGHHEVVISLAIKNVSLYPNCTGISGYDTHLYDSRGFEYSQPDFGSAPMGVTSLVSGETTGGVVKFQIWDGTSPRSLSLSRNVSWERDCAEKQHRAVDMHGGSMVRIPIEGVPVVGPFAQR